MFRPSRITVDKIDVDIATLEMKRSRRKYRIASLDPLEGDIDKALNPKRYMVTMKRALAADSASSLKTPTPLFNAHSPCETALTPETGRTSRLFSGIKSVASKFKQL